MSLPDDPGDAGTKERRGRAREGRVSRPRVLLAIDGSGAGGGQEIVAVLARGCLDSGLDVTVVTRPGGPLVGRLTGMGATVVPFSFPSFPDPGSLIVLRKLLERSHATLFHTHGGVAGAWVRIAAHGLRVLTVHTYHGIHHLHFPEGPRRWIHGLIERSLAASTTRLVCVGREDMELGIQHGMVPKDRGRLIVNGIDPDPGRWDPGMDRAACRTSLGLPSDVFVLGTVGRFHPQKDPLTLVEAFRRLAAAEPALRLAWVGEGPLESAVRRALQAAGLEGRAWLLPPSTDLATFYRAIDVFALSSLWEGLPLVILEAMAAGCPVVATEVTGTRELIDPGRTGLLVPPRDPGALATAVRSIRAGHSLDLEGAREQVRQDFGHTRMVQQYLELYRELGISPATSASGRPLPGP